MTFEETTELKLWQNDVWRKQIEREYFKDWSPHALVVNLGGPTRGIRNVSNENIVVRTQRGQTFTLHPGKTATQNDLTGDYQIEP